MRILEVFLKVYFGQKVNDSQKPYISDLPLKFLLFKIK